MPTPPPPHVPPDLSSSTHRKIPPHNPILCPPHAHTHFFTLPAFHPGQRPVSDRNMQQSTPRFPLLTRIPARLLAVRSNRRSPVGAATTWRSPHASPPRSSTTSRRPRHKGPSSPASRRAWRACAAVPPRPWAENNSLLKAYRPEPTLSS